MDERQPLLENRRRPRPPRPRGRYWKALLMGMGALAIGLLAILCASIDTIPPAFYGLRENLITGSVDVETTYHNGLYFLGPRQRFIQFPAYQVLLEYSSKKYQADSPPIQARTGRDLSDPDSGGQPINLSLSVIYHIPAENVGLIYSKFGLAYQQRFVQFVQQAVSDCVQQFHPEQFWSERPIIDAALLKTVAQRLHKQGHIRIRSLQVLRLEFLDAFEDTIVAIQLAVQTRTTNEYNYSVMQVVKDIDIAASRMKAEVVAVVASAQANSTILLNNASAVGFNLVQEAKAKAYQDMARQLNLQAQPSELIKYIKVRNIRSHSPANLTIGLESPLDRRRKRRQKLQVAAQTAPSSHP